MRNLILIALIFYLFACTEKKPAYSPLDEPVAHLYDSLLRPFYHGVASGDPMSDRVIIWTRVTPEDALPEVAVTWQMSESERFDQVIKEGSFTTDPARDYTVKVDVEGLEPGSVYYYRFSALGENSIIGRTKTISESSDSLQFAVVSCSNYEWGYFSAYGHIGDHDILDAVIHLGDYIYEYAPGGYGDTTIGRKHIPEKEIITLQDYRTRYSQYRLDPDLRSAHASHPFIAIWDDHEIANDTYVTGAQNHQEGEGPFEDRKRAAIQTYYEWMPIREAGELYRSFDFGKLADLIMLDERIVGRSKQLDSISDPTYKSEDRSMLGEEQLSWLKDQLTRSDSKWKIIGNQVIYSDLDRSAVFPNSPRNLDSWDGYPAEKNALASFIKANDLENIIFITGDTHSSWAFEVVVGEVSEEPVAVEFGTTSINSANYDEYSSLDTARMAEKHYLESNAHLKYSNLADHGYLLLTLTTDRAKADYFYTETLKKPDAKRIVGPSFEVFGANKIQRVGE